MAGVALVSAGVAVQLLLEVTLGRIFFAPNILVLILTYLSLNYGNAWSMEGAFWSGASLDLLLHQPLGSSSLGLLIGLLAGKLVLAAVPGENRLTIVLSGTLAALVCDTVFFLAASRPLFMNLGQDLLVVFQRMLVTMIVGTVAILSASAASMLREGGKHEAV